MSEVIDLIRGALQEQLCPYLGVDWVSAKVVQDIGFVDGEVRLRLRFGFPVDDIRDEIQALVSEWLAPISEVRAVNVVCDWRVRTHGGQPGLKAIPGVKNIIAVASGKGGVGKSTTSVNLALALALAGARVGILDADIHGPNQPQMLGVSKKPELNGKKLKPVIAHGLQSMSIGYLVDSTTPTIWRGPMVSSALQQLLNETEWDEVDYLIVDLPPGTGDIQLTLSKKIPVSGAVIVTTPQDIALLDARKGYEMFGKVNVAVLGVIENMSTHICSQCGHEEAIFGSGGGEAMAAATQIPLLGQLPLAISIRTAVDQGQPTVATAPTSQYAKIYRNIARKIVASLSLLPVNYSSKLPGVVVE